MGVENYYLFSIILYGVSAFVGFVMLGVAISQLKKLTEQVKAAGMSNEINCFMSLLDIEKQIDTERKVYSIVLDEMIELKGKTVDDTKNRSLKLKFIEAKERYFNKLDRLCYAIRLGFLDSDKMRSEYMDLIRNTVMENGEDFHPVTTQYKNILSVYNEWNK